MNSLVKYLPLENPSARELCESRFSKLLFSKVVVVPCSIRNKFRKFLQTANLGKTFQELGGFFSGITGNRLLERRISLETRSHIPL